MYSVIILFRHTGGCLGKVHNYIGRSVLKEIQSLVLMFSRKLMVICLTSRKYYLISVGDGGPIGTRVCTFLCSVGVFAYIKSLLARWLCLF